MEPLIIEVAMNGETPVSHNPHVPRLPAEIGEVGLLCLRQGAALLHNHIDDPMLTGDAAAQRYAEGWAQIVAQRPDVILCPTLAGGEDESERVAHLEKCAREYGARMGALDPGSMNLPLTGGSAVDARVMSYVNTYKQIEESFDIMAKAGMGASMGIYEPGFLRAAVGFKKAGKLPPGSLAKLYFFGGRNFFDGKPCTGFGLDPTAAALDAYLDILDGTGIPWSVAVMGGCVFESGMARLAIERGGHIRLGLEDFEGDRTPSNAQLIDEVVELARAMGRPAATPRQAAELLGLP